MTKIIDVTVPLSAELPTFPGDPAFQLESTHRLADGEAYNVARLSLGTHTGTHVDAPFHFLPDGATVDELPLEILMGKARVVDLGGRDSVDRADLEAVDLREDLRVLLKTRNSGQLRQQAFQEDYVYLTPDAATYLAQVGIKLVGFDYLSIEKFGSRRLRRPPGAAGGGRRDRRGARPVGRGARRVRHDVPALAHRRR